MGFDTTTSFNITIYLITIWGVVVSSIFFIRSAYRKNEVSIKRILLLNKNQIYFLLNVGNILRVILLIILSSCIFLEYDKVILPILIYLFMYQLFSNYFLFEISDSSDRLILIVLLGLLLSFPFNKNTSLLFIALNSVTAYFFTGYKKLNSNYWRTGKAVYLVMNTETYGNFYISKLLKDNLSLRLFISWSIILFQLGFPLVFLLNNYFSTIYIFTGILFHLMIMVSMRLHNFFFAFLCTYPSLFFLAFF